MSIDENIFLYFIIHTNTSPHRQNSVKTGWVCQYRAFSLTIPIFSPQLAALHVIAWEENMFGIFIDRSPYRRLQYLRTCIPDLVVLYDQFDVLPNIKILYSSSTQLLNWTKRGVSFDSHDWLVVKLLSEYVFHRDFTRNVVPINTTWWIPLPELINQISYVWRRIFKTSNYKIKRKLSLAIILCFCYSRARKPFLAEEVLKINPSHGFIFTQFCSGCQATELKIMSKNFNGFAQFFFLGWWYLFSQWT